MAERVRKRTARPRTGEQLASAYPISVVIPVRDRWEVVARTLEALYLNDLNQTEIILVNDASETPWPSVAEGLGCPTDFRRIDLPVRQGPAGARNAGLDAARFPHVLFLDADVLLPSESLAWIRESLDIYSHRAEVAGVLGCYSPEAGAQGFISEYKNLYTSYLYDSTEALSPFVHTAIFLVQRDLLRSVGGFDASLNTAEDFQLGLKLGSRGYRFAIDRRVRGTHLKAFSLSSVLREDLRRIRDLRRVQVDSGQEEFYWKAQRPERLVSVALPVLVLVSLAASAWKVQFLLVAGLLSTGFVALNLPFLSYCRRHQGFAFAVGSALTLFLEMGWASLVLLTSVFGPSGKKKTESPAS